MINLTALEERCRSVESVELWSVDLRALIEIARAARASSALRTDWTFARTSADQRLALALKEVEL